MVHCFLAELEVSSNHRLSALSKNASNSALKTRPILQMYNRTAFNCRLDQSGLSYGLDFPPWIVRFFLLPHNAPLSQGSRQNQDFVDSEHTLYCKDFQTGIILIN